MPGPISKWTCNYKNNTSDPRRILLCGWSCPCTLGPTVSQWGTSHDFIKTYLATTCLNRCINYLCEGAYKLAKWKSPTAFNSTSTPCSRCKKFAFVVCQTPCASPQRDICLSLWPVSLKVFGRNSNLTENINTYFKCCYLNLLSDHVFATVTSVMDCSETCSERDYISHLIWITIGNSLVK